MAQRIVALIVLTFTVFYEKLQCGNAIPLGKLAGINY